jgi:ABC-2 type transport system permease protein
MSATTTAGPPVPTRTASRGAPVMKLATDTATVFVREVGPVLRSPLSMVFGMVQPLVFLGLFAPLLGGMPGMGGGEALQWFVPGVLVMLTLFGSGSTGANLQQEIQTGSHERMLVTPLSRPSLLMGRALKEIAPVLAQALVVIVVTVPFGFDLPPLGALVGLGILGVFAIGMGSLSYSLALAVKDQDWMFWVIQQTLLFPMLLLSGMMLPIDNGPAWLQVASLFNPLTYIVEAERALFTTGIGDTAVLWGLVAALVTAAAGLWTGTSLMRRATV